jgi:hypothetical protein
MSEINHHPGVVKMPFRPASHYDSPDEVLADHKLSAAEKRVILSSWASDMYAVDSNPALRKVPGIAQSMRLEDILRALRQLDGENDPSPRGGAAMRVWRPIAIDAVARARMASQCHSPRKRSWVAASR